MVEEEWESTPEIIGDEEETEGIEVEIGDEEIVGEDPVENEEEEREFEDGDEGIEDSEWIVREYSICIIDLIFSFKILCHILKHILWSDCERWGS